MFRFKQFTIRQDQTAMKVCTDACVLGAYADVGDSNTIPIRILDIGTGTGLLALMAAQRNPTALIDAVEVDEAAFRQAKENVASSPFSDRVQVWKERVQVFVPPFPSPPAPLPVGEGGPAGWSASGWLPSPQGRSAVAGGAGGKGIYHRILTNPPFYTNNLRSPDPAINRALHTDELPFAELVEAVERLLSHDGQWWVLLPPYETTQLTNLATTAGLHPFRQLHLRHNDDKPVFRVVTGFAYAQQPVVTETMAIYETSTNTYTPLFRALLRDFYLIF
jgi:tRNA1Val (adenine37-N6)-methyltransferase